MAPATLKYKLKKVEDGGAGDEKPVCAFFTLPQGCRNGAKCPFVHGEAGAAAASEERPRVTPTTMTGTTKNAQAMQQVRTQLAAEQQEQAKKRTVPVPTTPTGGAAARKRIKREEPEVEETTFVEEAEEEEASAPRVKPTPPARRIPVATTTATAQASKKVAAAATTARTIIPGKTADDVMNPFLAVARPPSSATTAAAAPTVAATAPKQQSAVQQQQQQQQKKQVTPAPTRNVNNNKSRGAPVANATVPVPAVAAAVSAQRKSVPGHLTAASGKTRNGVGMLGKLSALPITPFTIARKHKEEQQGRQEEEQEEPQEEEQGELEEGEVEEEEVEPVVEEEVYVPPPVVNKAKKQPPARPQQQARQQQQQQQQQLAVEEEEEAEEVCTHGGSNWSCCVKATMEHARFEPNYRMMANKKKGEADWIEAKKHGAWCKDLPHVLALDCEMCATRDPVSMEQDGKALIRLSVVSGHDENQVLLDTLVLPSLPVVDYRTDIHGIRPEDLRQVMFTFRHAQAAMLHLCCTETVLVGHGLCNDLTALKMKHSRVVDTALLFEREDAPNHTPALKDVAGALLGLDMPDMHDSVADAQVTLRIARHFLEQGPVAPVPRLPAASNKKGRRAEAQQSCLLLHRLPLFVTAAHITEMFQSRTHVMPVAVDPVVATGGGEGSLGRATARFLSKQHADLAFTTLTGPARPDKDGRPQKRVHLAGKKDYVQVRLMYSPEEEQRQQQQQQQEEGEGGGGEGGMEEMKVF